MKNQNNQPQTAKEEAVFYLSNLKYADTITPIASSDTLLAIYALTKDDNNSAIFLNEDKSISVQFYTLIPFVKNTFTCVFPKEEAITAVNMYLHPHRFNFVPFNDTNVAPAAFNVLNEFKKMGYKSQVSTRSKKEFISYLSKTGDLVENYTIVGPKKPAQKQAF